MRSERLAPLSGIVFVALIVLGFIVIGGDTPETKDSAAKVASFYGDHHGKETAAAVVVALGAVFLAIFVGALRARLRNAGDQGGTWQNLVLIGGSVAVAGFLFAVSVHVALADGGDHNISPDALAALNALDNDSFFGFSVPLGIMLIGVAGSSIRTAALPKWLGWAALVLGIVYFTPAGFVAFGLSGIWIIIASILMFQRAGAPSATATPAA